MNFIGGVRYVCPTQCSAGCRTRAITPRTGLASSSVYSQAVRQPFGEFQRHLRFECSVNTLQVLVHHHLRVHVYHRCRSGRNLFGSTPQWVHLYLGCRECRCGLCQIFRFLGRLVVLNCMDDVRRRQLPGQGLATLQLRTSF